MIPSRMRIVGVVASALLVAGACSTSAATSPAAQSVAPAVKVVATAPADQLIKAGTLTVCSDTSYPPQESLDENNKAVGVDVDLVNVIAARMGLTATVRSSDFDTIIDALAGGSCDIIVSAQTITAKRLEAVDMIPYFAAGQSFVVLKGNPKGIKTLDDLCGKTVAAEKGTVEADHVLPDGTGDYKVEEGLSQQCEAKGKAKISLSIFTKDTDALLALQSGTVVAHFTDEPVANYEVAQGNGAFEVVSSLTLEHAPEGIAVAKNHSGLRDAVKASLQSMMDDGTYMTILKKWGVESGAITSTNP